MIEIYENMFDRLITISKFYTRFTIRARIGIFLAEENPFVFAKN